MKYDKYNGPVCNVDAPRVFAMLVIISNYWMDGNN